jgi:mono/diheme cytochrome c family protein
LEPKWSDELVAHLTTASPQTAFCVDVVGAEPPDLAPNVIPDAIDYAMSKYAHTTLAQVDEPPQLSKAFEPPWLGYLAPTLLPSSMPDVPHDGAGLSPGQLVNADGKGWTDVDIDFAEWDADAAIAAVKVCKPFNLTDVMEAAVRADRVDAAYRAFLPVMANFVGSNDDAAVRDELGSHFIDVYLDRDLGCMGCHTATYSRTDARPRNQNWDRFDPVWVGLPFPLDLEGSVFSQDLAGGDFLHGGEGGDAVLERVGSFFRQDNHAGLLRPWGIEEACVTNPARGFTGYDAALGPDPLGRVASFAGVGPNKVSGVLDLADDLSEGISTLGAIGFAVPDWQQFRDQRGAAVNGNPGCAGCHEQPGAQQTGLPSAPFLRHAALTMSDQRLFSVIRHGSGAMPAQFADDASAWDAVAWVRATYPHVPAIEVEDRSHGFALMTATSITNRVIEEVLGEPATLSHRYPRNPTQANMLSTHMQEFVRDFSLRGLLSDLLLSEAFNRAAPASLHTPPYVLPMLPEPFAEVLPGTEVLASDSTNSEGDFVHKHSATGWLQQVHGALGWPEPRLHGYDQQYPSSELMRRIGRYTQIGREEVDQVSLYTMLVWENEVATCEKPAAVLAKDVDFTVPVLGPDDVLGPAQWEDWIDRLVDEAELTGATWHELAVAIRDRLIADPFPQGNEMDLVKVLFGGVALEDSPAAGGIDANEEARLRDYCGALLASPEFLLRGPRLDPALPAGLPDRVCLDGELCAEGDLFWHYAGVANSLGHVVK